MKIHTNLELYLDSVYLNLSLTEDLKPNEGNLKNFGYIKVTNGDIEEDNCFWDNISFFIKCGEEEFRKECKQDLKSKGFKIKAAYKTIKKLIKRAKKLNLIE